MWSTKTTAMRLTTPPRRRIAVIVLAVVVLAPGAMATAQAPLPAGLEPADPPETSTDGSGNFRMSCTLSHANYDDPLVFPDVPGATHLHAYYGNVDADASTTTVERLRQAATTTCHGQLRNASAYWVPSMHGPDGEVRWPLPMQVYYKNGVLPFADVQPMPEGLRIIAGSARSTPEDPGDLMHTVRYRCLTTVIGGYQDFSDHIPVCEQGDTLVQSLMFPQCWDGVRLDSPDHQSHMAYAEVPAPGAPHACPASHPVPLPQITYNLDWPIDEPAGTRGWHLSSDGYRTADPDASGGYSAHGDWFGAWDPDVMSAFVTSCINRGMDCNGGDLGNGTRLTPPTEGRGTIEDTRGDPAIGSCGLSPDPGGVDRVAGGDRIGTAVAVSQAGWDRADDVVVATAAAHADALAAVALAAALDAPVLLTWPDALPPAAAAELARLRPARVTLIGGTAAVSHAVAGQIVDAVGAAALTRLAGAERTETAALVAVAAGAPAGEVALADGVSFHDALAAGALAATGDRVPLLLVTGATVGAAAEQALRQLHATRITLIGDVPAPADVQAGAEVVRIASDRGEAGTAAAVLADALTRRTTGGGAVGGVVFATGARYPDALAAGAYAARTTATLAIVPASGPVPADLATVLSSSGLGCGRVVGGPAAVDDHVAADLAALLAH